MARIEYDTDLHLGFLGNSPIPKQVLRKSSDTVRVSLEVYRFLLFLKELNKTEGVTSGNGSKKQRRSL